MSSRRFTWRSPKILYTAIVFLGAFIITIYNLLRLFQTGINSTKMSKSVAFVMSRPFSSDLSVPSATFVFYVTSMVTAVLFARLAMHWPCLALTWERLEREFTSRNRRVSRTTLATRFKIVTAVVMLLALSEFVARSERNPPRLCGRLVDETVDDEPVQFRKTRARAHPPVGLHALIALIIFPQWSTARLCSPRTSARWSARNSAATWTSSGLISSCNFRR
jgi:hypothetical protein